MSRLTATLCASAALLLAAGAPAQARSVPDPPSPSPGVIQIPPVDPADPVVPDPADPSAGNPTIPDTVWLPQTPGVVTTTTLKVVRGSTAMLRTDGRAAIPHDAPVRVRAIIRAANAIIGKPYKWGGGHGRLRDTGYDCSGAVSYALIMAGQLGWPLVSGDFAKTFAPGSGRWVTVYANSGHVYMEVAGLRLDTSPVGDPTGQLGVRWRPVIGQRLGFRNRHPLGL